MLLINYNYIKLHSYWEQEEFNYQYSKLMKDMLKLDVNLLKNQIKDIKLPLIVLAVIYKMLMGIVLEMLPMIKMISTIKEILLILSNNVKEYLILLSQQEKIQYRLKMYLWLQDF